MTTNLRSQQSGLFSLVFWFILKLISWTLLGWFCVLLTGGVLTLYLGHISGLAYLNQLLDSQLYYLSLIQQTLPFRGLLQLTVQTIQQIDHLLFIKTHLINLFHLYPLSDFSNTHLKDFLASSIGIANTYLKVLIVSTELMSVRLLILLFSLVGFSFILLLGFVDGLVQRDVRKFSGGHESALLYHRSKSLALSVFILGCFLYLVLPLSLKPEWILLPTAFICAYFVMLSTKYFKKIA